MLEDPFGLGDNFGSPGLLAGGQIGANYQIGNAVMGP